ncbi:hypothetical protein PDJAM_G00066460 [Pangasius djambal]|uniref:Uncharacterized protein n=1 Tax=Pangasius djambal TaxID=1691987 RepID=A0ACC5YZ27_9TELE|nr:hypothetical protein [Pangasius djambal]
MRVYVFHTRSSTRVPAARSCSAQGQSAVAEPLFAQSYSKHGERKSQSSFSISKCSCSVLRSGSSGSSSVSGGPGSCPAQTARPHGSDGHDGRGCGCGLGRGPRGGRRPYRSLQRKQLLRNTKTGSCASGAYTSCSPSGRAVPFRSEAVSRLCYYSDRPQLVRRLQ